MSGIIETNDIVYVKEIVEMQTELKNDEIIDTSFVKKGRGRPKKEPKPENDAPVVAKKKGRPKLKTLASLAIQKQVGIIIKPITNPIVQVL